MTKNIVILKSKTGSNNQLLSSVEPSHPSILYVEPAPMETILKGISPVNSPTNTPTNTPTDSPIMSPLSTSILSPNIPVKFNLLSVSTVKRPSLPPVPKPMINHPQPRKLVTIDQFIRKRSITTNNSNQKERQLINVYCDGSTINNGKKNAAGGIGVYFGQHDSRNISEPFLLSIPTNQKAELYAMLRTLQILTHMIEENTHIEYECHIYTDSEYTINCLDQWIPTWMNHDWHKADGKKVKNLDLLKQISSYYYNYRRLFKLHHIRSHTGDETPQAIGNKNADQLAVKGTHQHPNFRKN